MIAKSLENLLNPSNDGDLQDIVRRARDMGELAAALAAALPDAQAVGLVAANVKDDGELVVICQSPAWASRLRFETDRLLEAAAAHGTPAERCTIRVARGD
jgi:hypothetical protein